MNWTEWNLVEENNFTDILYEKKYHQELEGGVARITINRPQKLNALTAHTMDELFHAFYEANHDPTVGVIVLAGSGDKAFLYRRGCSMGGKRIKSAGLLEVSSPPNNKDVAQACNCRG